MVRAMSEASSNVVYMQTAIPRLSVETENETRLLGLVQMLTLPFVRAEDGNFRRRAVELEIAPGRWETIEGFALEGSRITVWRGTNSTRVQFTFQRGECPSWRVERPAEQASYMAEGA